MRVRAGRHERVAEEVAHRVLVTIDRLREPVLRAHRRNGGRHTGMLRKAVAQRHAPHPRRAGERRDVHAIRVRDRRLVREGDSDGEHERRLVQHLARTPRISLETQSSLAAVTPAVQAAEAS